MKKNKKHLKKKSAIGNMQTNHKLEYEPYSEKVQMLSKKREAIEEKLFNQLHEMKMHENDTKDDLFAIDLFKEEVERTEKRDEIKATLRSKIVSLLNINLDLNNMKGLEAAILLKIEVTFSYCYKKVNEYYDKKVKEMPDHKNIMEIYLQYQDNYPDVLHDTCKMFKPLIEEFDRESNGRVKLFLDKKGFLFKSGEIDFMLLSEACSNTSWFKLRDCYGVHSMFEIMKTASSISDDPAILEFAKNYLLVMKPPSEDHNAK